MSNNIELKSEKTKALLGKIPHTLLKISYISLFLFVLLIFILLFTIPWNNNIKLPLIIEKDTLFLVTSTSSSAKIAYSYVSRSFLKENKISVGQKVLIRVDDIYTEKERLFTGEIFTIGNRTSIPSLNRGYIQIRIRFINSESLKFYQPINAEGYIQMPKKNILNAIFDNTIN